MTKEEYKENIIRMWDSVRTDNKGAENCGGVRCLDCPLYMKAQCGPVNSFEYIDLVENWAKEHPFQTNADKFREVFGVESLPFFMCQYDFECEDCKDFCDGQCKATERFWKAEYKGGVDGE